LEADQV